MPNGGRLTVATRNLGLWDPHRPAGLAERDYVAISLGDTGGLWRQEPTRISILERPVSALCSRLVRGSQRSASYPSRTIAPKSLRSWEPRRPPIHLAIYRRAVIGAVVAPAVLPPTARNGSE